MALKVGELFASFDLDASGMNGTIRSIESSLEGIGASMVQVGSTLSSALTQPLVSFGKNALDAGMSFTAQMSTVEAISGATADEMEKLNAKALEMGSTTQFTATEAGEALEYMAMAGWKTDDMLEGLAPIMNLAAASGENLGTTSDIVTDALTAFGLKAEDAGHFSDILAVASSNANTNVSMMGETFKYVAPVAGALGYKAEDVAMAIGLMANSGIKAGQAGTALRAALSSMANPSDKAANYMDKVGISLTTASGEMKPFNELIGDMRKGFSKLSDAEQVQAAAAIFGQEAMSGMLAIINASDEDIAKLTASIEDCDGATQRMADTVLDNAKGDLTLFQSAVEGAQVALFKLNEGAIRGVIQSATGLVEKFNAADDATKQLALKAGILAAAMGPALVYGGKLAMMLAKIGPALAALVSPMGLVAAAFALFGLAAIDADNAIGTAFTSMAQKAAASLPAIGAQITTAIADISTRIPALAGSITAGIDALVPAVVETAASIITALLGAFTENADSIAAIGLSIVTSIVDSIAASAPTLLPAAFAAIVAALTALIDNAPALLESGINLAAKIVEGIMSTDWAALGTDLLSSVTGALETAAAAATEAIQTAVSGILDAIQSALGIEEGDTLSQIGTKVIDGIKAGLKAAAEAALSAITAIGTSIWNGIKTGLGIGENAGEGEADTAGETLIQKIVTGIENAVSGAIETVKTVSSGIWNAIKSAIGLGEEGEGDADKIGLDIVGKIVSGLTSAVGSAVDVVKGIFGGIWTAITSAIGGGSDEGESGESMAMTAASGIVDGLISGFRSAVSGVIETVKTIFGGIWDAIKSVFGFGKDKGQESEDAREAEEAGKSIMTGMKDGVTDSQEEVTTAVSTATAAIITQIETDFGISGDTSTVTQAHGQALMQGVKGGIEAEQGAVQTAVQTLVTLMTTAFQPIVQDFGLTTRQAMMSAASGIIIMNPTVAQAASTAGTNAIAAMRAVMNGSAGYDLGRDLMQGIINGISAMSGMLASAARSAVSSAVSAMRKAADAHSPSRETLALGEDMDEGAAIGLSGGLMAKSAAQAVKDALSAFTREAYLSDLSVGTVRTDGQNARDTASETAARLQSGDNSDEFARKVGMAMADRLIESGVMNREIVMNGRKVGEEVADPVSQKISQKTKSTVRGRSAQGVIA